MRETKPLPLQTEWLRAGFATALEGVDRANRIIRGFVMAQAGEFKTPGRGQFNQDGLQQIVRLASARPAGLKSRFAHPSLSDDGIGKFLGRVKNTRLANTRTREGAMVAAVRGDLHFDPTASSTPHGDLAGYVMSLAESDPDALSSSLVLQVEEIVQTDAKGRVLTDDEGFELVPLWMPTKLHAADIVDEGDAVDGLLSAHLDPDALPDAVVRRGSELLDRSFPYESREEIEKRCLGWLYRYLDLRFGALPPPAPTPRLDALRKRLEENSLTVNQRS